MIFTGESNIKKSPLNGRFKHQLRSHTRFDFLTLIFAATDNLQVYQILDKAMAFTNTI